MRLFVAIPAFNEEATIGDVIRSIPRDIVDEVKVLVVNDGSTDDTLSVSLEAGADFVVTNKSNKGFGLTTKIAIITSLEEGADIVVTMDADGQMNGADISKLISPILKDKADVVVASRFMNKENIRGMPFFKRMGNRFFTKTVSFLCGLKFTDTQCGFRAYSKEAAMHLNLSGGHTPMQEIIINLVYSGMTVIESDVSIKPTREIGQSKIVRNPFDYGFRALSIILRTYRDYHPLSFFGFFGMTFLISSLVIGLVMVFTPLDSRHQFLSWMSPDYFIFCLVSGLFLVVFASLADMNTRTLKIVEDLKYNQQKERYRKK